MFKVNNKDTRMTPMVSFWCSYCYLWTYLTPSSSVSFVNFEQVNADWENTHHNVFRQCYHRNDQSHRTVILFSSKLCCRIGIGLLHMEVRSRFGLMRHYSQHTYRTWNVMGYIIYWSCTGIPQDDTCSLKHWWRFEALLQVQVARCTSILKIHSCY